MQIGRKLREDERKSKWSEVERIISEEDKRRVKIGEKLEREGFGLLADLTGENSINEPFYVVTPDGVVFTLYEIFAFKKIGLIGLSYEESQALEKSAQYISAYSPEILD